MRRVNEARLLSWAVALRQAQRPQAVAQVAEASLVVATTPRAVAALTLAAIRAVARPFRAKETDLKTTETQRHREFCAEIQKNSVTPCLCGEIKLLPYSKNIKILSV